MKKFFKITVLISVLWVWGHMGAIASDTSAEENIPETPSQEQDAPLLPPVEGDASQLSAVEKVFVSKFKLEGNTVFSNKELDAILAPYQNREISAEELQEAKNTLTRHYINNGYVNSGAIIPDQKIESGIITLRIIEGKLTKTEISGNDWLRTRYIQSRLDLSTGRGEEPLNIITLQERLKILKQEPLIDNINAELSPGLRPGEANLNVEVEEANPFHLTLTFNNHNSPSIGAYRGEIDVRDDNLTGWGDALSFQYGLTEGLDDYAASYTVPITRWDTTLSFEIDRSESVVVADPFDKLDIKSDTLTYAGSLRHPFYKTLSTEFAMGAKFEKRHTETSLLDAPFSFPESGADEETGETDFYVARFFQEWVNRSMFQVIAAYSSFNFGSVDEGELDGQFFTWLGQFQWLRRISPLNSQILFSTNVQISGDALVSAEKFAIGGSSSVRGYRENQMTTDSGLVSSLEWRIPLATLKIPGLSKGANDGLLHLCPFFDLGWGWNSDAEDPDPDIIYSAGLGLRWSVNERIYAEIYWGEALEDVENDAETDLQDDGIHFQISIGLF